MTPTPSAAWTHVRDSDDRPSNPHAASRPIPTAPATYAAASPPAARIIHTAEAAPAASGTSGPSPRVESHSADASSSTPNPTGPIHRAAAPACGCCGEPAGWGRPPVWRCRVRVSTAGV